MRRDHELLASTYVSHGGKWWNVSTTNRLSSAMEVCVYAETMVWEWDATERKRLGLAWQGESARDSLRTHIYAVERLFRGEPLDSEEDPS